MSFVTFIPLEVISPTLKSIGSMTSTGLKARFSGECLCPNTYKLTYQPRNSGRGGGTGALHKSSLSVKLQDTPTYISFEHSELCVTVQMVQNRRHIDYCYTVYPLDGTVMLVKEVEIESTSVHFKH